MNESASLPFRLLQGGLGNLAAYLAAHVLLCLLPAFFIAGAMTALIPKQMITRFLGRNTSKLVSYPAAVSAGSLLAVCSCTIVPLFAGIYRKGAGIGPAVAFLFFAPAANILALIYTGGIIGADLAFARLLLSLVFGIGIGLVMALIFRLDDAAREKTADTLFAAKDASGMRGGAIAFLFVWMILLLSGTLKVGILAGSAFGVDLPITGAYELQAWLDHMAPSDAAKGLEGVSVQGVVLVLMLGMVAVASWRGFEPIHEGFKAWTWVAIGLIAATLLVAALTVRAGPSGLEVEVTGRFLGVFAALVALAWIGHARLTEDELIAWLWESWRFTKQIFPLLIAGVFLVGILRALIRPEWVQILAGRNTLAGNAAGVVFGVFMYFPTLVEVPVARMFLDLGMHRGPLLSYLMADPELSLQSILILTAIMGKIKTWTYVGWVAIFSAMAGFIYGSWEDGADSKLLLLFLLLFLSVLGLALWLSARRIEGKSAADKAPPLGGERHADH